MDATDTGTQPRSLGAARIVPIAQLSPDLADPSTAAVGGVVTITWPYNKVKGTFAFSLAEPDFRLRRNKGQVRIHFTGRTAKAVGGCELGSNDEVLLSLAGAAWEADETNKRRSLPGADLGWRLVFSETVLLKIKRAETGETDLVDVSEQAYQPETSSGSSTIQPPAPAELPSPPAPLSPVRFTSPVREKGKKRFNDDEFASPAFVKRARMSYGSLFEDGFDIFQDADMETRGRKRTRFGRDSSAWRYTSRSPSPEPVAPSPENADGQVSSPTRAVSTPTRVEMADEGCQTMELDPSSPQPDSAPPRDHPDTIPPKPSSADDTPFDVPTEPVMENIPTSTSIDQPPESRTQNASAPNSSRIEDSHLDVPPSNSEQVNSLRNDFAGNPWTVGMTPSAAEHHKLLFPPSHEGVPFASSGFADIAPSNQPIPPGEGDGLDESHTGDVESREIVHNRTVPSTELDSPALDYPQLDPIDETYHQPVHDEALTDYPASYLENNRTSPSTQALDEQAPQKPATAEVGTSSWATVNQPLNATVNPSTDRLGSIDGSRDGTTPEQPFIIDESDSESEPEPMAVEDTVNDGRAYALDAYEDAEAEDEIDAQYSDDDEPEYDTEEMGGDYDTRNYEQPDDDDDGGYDGDLPQPRSDPEFGEGGSWGEQEEEVEFPDEEDESEYDDEILEPNPQNMVRANPTVIDLISSSEDESEGGDEDEDEGENVTATEVQRPGAHIDSRTSLDHQEENDSGQVNVNDDDSEIVSQAPISEADYSSDPSDPSKASSEDRGDAISNGEEDGDEDQSKKNTEELNQKELEANESVSESNELEEVSSLEPSEDQTERYTEPKTELKGESGPESDVMVSGVDERGDLTSQQTMPQTDMLGNTAEIRRENPEDDSVSVPLSAADGLEMLSRAVDEESTARSRGLFAESIVEKVVMETVSHQHQPAEPAEEVDNEMQDLLDNQLNTALEKVTEEGSVRDNAEDQVDQIEPLKVDAETPPSVTRSKEPTSTKPFPPPLDQSFQSRMGEDGNSAFGETAVNSAAHINTTQLPTPLDTQVTDTTLNASTSFHMAMAESFDSYTTIEHPTFQDKDGSIKEKSVSDPAQQDVDFDMDKDENKQERGSALVVEIEAGRPSGVPPVPPSPTPSFQTQVDGEEPARVGNEEQTEIDSQLIRELSPQSSSHGSDTKDPVTLHTDFDEELQASILENTLLEEQEEDTHHGTYEDYGNSSQFDTDAASIEAKQTEQTGTMHSLLHDYTPARQLAEEISAQLRRNFVINGSTSGEDSDTSMLNDPSVHLARVANASKRGRRKRASSSQLHRPRRRTLDVRRSPSPGSDNSSIRLARASLASQTSKSEEDSPSMTAAKLQLARHLRDVLPDYCSLESLRQHVTKKLDVMAVASMQPPEPRRAKGGPREYMMSFTISDYSIGPYNVAEAFIYRPHKESLPVIRYGDVILFRNFTVVSLAGKGFGLRSNDESSWAVFDYDDEPAQIRGPPVEYIQKEIAYVNYLREWFSLLDAKARARLETATQNYISAGRSK